VKVKENVCSSAQHYSCPALIHIFPGNDGEDRGRREGTKAFTQDREEHRRRGGQSFSAQCDLVLNPAIQANIQAAGEKVGELKAEKDALPGIQAIEAERDSLKDEIGRNKDEIRECKVRELVWLLIGLIFAQ
jgi:hypothetical protein